MIFCPVYDSIRPFSFLLLFIYSPNVFVMEPHENTVTTSTLHRDEQHNWLKCVCVYIKKMVLSTEVKLQWMDVDMIQLL